MRRALIFTFAASTLVMHFILPYAAMAEEHINEGHLASHPPPNNSENFIITTARPLCKKVHADTIIIEELPHHIEIEVSENELEELDEHLFVFFYTSKINASGSGIKEPAYAKASADRQGSRNREQMNSLGASVVVLNY